MLEFDMPTPLQNSVIKMLKSHPGWIELQKIAEKRIEDTKEQGLLEENGVRLSQSRVERRFLDFLNGLIEAADQPPQANDGGYDVATE